MTQPPTPNPEARSALLKTLASQSRPAADAASERERFELSAIARTWAYRSEHGLRFYPSHDGGGDLWKGWLAAKADMSTPAPQIDASAGCVDSSGWHEPWRVGEFTSSANRPAHVLMLAVGEKQIAEYGAHRDFVRWVYPPAESTDGLAQIGAL